MSAEYVGKTTCGWCGKTVAAYVPAHGDGSAAVMRAHNNTKGDSCEGWAAHVSWDSIIGPDGETR